MTLDGGWGLIIATIVGVVLVWIGNVVGKHFGNSEDASEKAHSRIAELSEKLTELAMSMVRHERHVAENYVKQSAFERLEEKIDRLIAPRSDRHD